ncbi:MAG: DUF1573 domain-containing protein [Phycisphaerales bacterium]
MSTVLTRVLVPLFLWVIHAATPAAAQDVLAFEQTRIDAGPVPDTEPVRRAFRFTNISQRTVKIEIKNCSFCPKPECDKERLAPGESAVVVLELPTMGKYDQVEATADVSAAGHRGSNVRIALAARVRPLVRIEPGFLNLPEVVQRAGAVESITVIGRQQGFKIKGIECEQEWVTATTSEPREVEDLGERCTAYDITYRLRPGLPLGELEVRSAIVTSDPLRERVGFSISGRVVGDLTARPGQVTLRAMRPGSVFRAEFDLLTRTGDPVLSGMVSLAPAPKQGIRSCVLDATLGDEPGVLRIAVCGIAPERAMPIFEFPVVVTVLATGERLEVPIRINVREDAR